MTWIFLPGMDGTGDLLAPVVKEMPRDDVCVIVRYPRTRVCDRSELYSIAREALPDFEDYILVAESFSGPFAVELASQKPKRMRGLVLAATFADSPIRGVAKLLARLFGPLAMMLPPPAFLIRALLTGKDSTDDQVEIVRSAIRSVKASAFAARLKIVLRSDCTALLPHIKIPTLILGATHDQLVSPQITDELYSNIVGARLDWLDAPHLALFTRPQLATQAMRSFAAVIASK
jgi:pimeloyl-ACP methyl ester carboxylesterase